jgi:membrane protein
MCLGTSFEALRHAIARARCDHIALIAAGVAFFMLLAIFPGLAAALTVYSMFSNANEGGPLLSLLPAVLPDQVTQFLSGQIKQIAERQQDPKSPFDWATFLALPCLSGVQTAACDQFSPH